MAKEPAPGVLERALTDRQAFRLAELSGLDSDDLVGRKIGEINERFRERLPLEFLWFRRICGTVVKRNPVTGELMPVPGAEVTVLDTDCNFLTYNPGGGLIWIYPGLCHTETIGTAVTDECGRFCVWVPRWEFDWILRWRRERICFPYERPTIIDVIDPGWIDPPPLPDPGWIDPLPEIRLRDGLREQLGAAAADRIAVQATARGIGTVGSSRRLLREPLPPTPPPMPDKSPQDILGYTPDPLGPVDWHDWRGPFLLCKDVFIPEWSINLDVPDITFRVTQEIGGSDVVIYSEGLFDVRWDDTGVDDVVLEASAVARAVTSCDGPHIECDTVPAIVSASLMPLQPGYHDNTTGYGLRVNRPSTDGETQPALPLVPNAEAPIADRLDLFGCAHVGSATHYRMLYELDGAPAQPLTGFSWTAQRTDGTLVTITPDADGWIQIQNLREPWNHLLTAWPTHRSEFSDGTYQLTLETGSPGGSGNQTSAPVTFEVDNSYPRWDQFLVDYRVATGPWVSLDLAACPKVERGPGQTVDIRLRWQASADHLRSARVGFGGCSASSQPTLTTSSDTTQWWWRTVGSKTTSGLEVTRWRIEPDDEAGCYTLSAEAFGRAYNPAVPGLDLSDDYFGFEQRRRTYKSASISIVDA